jgi:hypothetical protein
MEGDRCDICRWYNLRRYQKCTCCRENKLLQSRFEETIRAHWIKTDTGFKCSKCGEESKESKDFCQYCWAVMDEF